MEGTKQRRFVLFTNINMPLFIINLFHVKHCI
jgi:hypothetical protein